jgi:hypothetical protein
MVTTMTTWAREHGVTDGELTILAIEPPTTGPAALTSGLVFSTIHLGT